MEEDKITSIFINALLILTIVCCFGFVFCKIMLWKNEITYINHMKISDALFAYIRQQIEDENFEEYLTYVDQIETYKKTFWRLWDWGYDNIIPKEIFEKIKPYIVEN